MKFASTRGKCQTVTFEQALLSGYAGDGGMLLPQEIPRLNAQTLTRWQHLSYLELLTDFMALFVGDQVTKDDLSDLVVASFQGFGRSTPAGLVVDPIALSQLPVGDKQVQLLQLWHGPTLAFKDVALQLVGKLIAFFVRRANKSEVEAKDSGSSSLTSAPSLNVLVGTSGDTGSAAIEAIRGLPNVNITVLYPLGRVSRIQELQMITVTDSNVHVIGVEGTSDDLDVPIKRVFDDAKFSTHHKLCSINSINVVRILVQTAHFFWAYLRALSVKATAEPAPKPKPEADPALEAAVFSEPVAFCIPTGACGHLIAGLLAREMWYTLSAMCSSCASITQGLPVSTLCAAVNDNDIVTKFLATGEFRPAEAVTPTTSPSMDIQVPYNIERLLYFMTGYGGVTDPEKRAVLVRGWMDQLSKEGRFQLSEEWRAALARMNIVSVTASQEQVAEAMRAAWEQGELVDPHTAVSLHAVSACPKLAREPNVICLATAHAAKFTETVSAATGVEMKELDRIFATSEYLNVARVGGLQARPTRCLRFAKTEDWEQRLRQLIEGF